MGCNGDCYQGRWCHCASEDQRLYSERKTAYTFAVLFILIITAIVWSLS